MNYVWQKGRSQAGLSVRSHLCPLVSGCPCKNLFTTFAPSHLPVNCILPIWISRPLPPSPWSRMMYQPQLLNESSGLIFLWNPCMYIHIKFGCFLLLMSHVNLIISPARRTSKDGRKMSLSTPTQVYPLPYLIDNSLGTELLSTSVLCFMLSTPPCT